jgi:hypothetical protein
MLLLHVNLAKRIRKLLGLLVGVIAVGFTEKGVDNVTRSCKYCPINRSTLDRIKYESII